MEFSELLQHRIIFLSQEINDASTNRLISQLLLLDADNPKERIDFYINCSGGSVLDGLAILDTISCIQAPVSTICIGHAASMAAWILAAGVPGQRFATPNAEVMIHQMAAGIHGYSTNILSHAERIRRLQDRMVEMLSQYTGQSKDRITVDIQRDFFMTSEEAKTYGLIDDILQPVIRGGNQMK